MSLSQYSLTLPKVVYSGQNSSKEITNIIKTYSSICIFCDNGVKNAGVADSIIEKVSNSCENLTIITDIPIEPTIYQAKELIDKLKNVNIDLLIGIGGGSTIDIVKLASVLYTNEYSITDLLNNSNLAKKYCLLL